MTAISAIGTALKKFSGKPMLVTSKVLGTAAIASVIYDSHINGRERAYSMDENDTADRFYNQFNQYMQMDKPSATLAKAKKWWFDVQQTFSYYHLISRTKGYSSGFSKTIATNLPLIGLSVLALFPKTPLVNKISGSLIAASGLKTFMYDVVGITNKKEFRKY